MTEQRGARPQRSRWGHAPGGQVIENYPDDAPYPSALVLGFARDRPVHVVVALDTSAPEAHIITVYEPSPDEFEPDSRTRRKR
jgi:hypothetical protein